MTSPVVPITSAIVVFWSICMEKRQHLIKKNDCSIVTVKRLLHQITSSCMNGIWENVYYRTVQVLQTCLLLNKLWLHTWSRPLTCPLNWRTYEDLKKKVSIYDSIRSSDTTQWSYERIRIWCYTSLICFRGQLGGSSHSYN